MSREIRLQEVKKHDNSQSLWMVIHDEVYDVTKFIDEHPGGAESLLDYAGKDGTEAFEDVGHSEDARELLKQYKIGVLPQEERNVAPCPSVTDYNKDCMVYATRPPKPHKCDLLGPPSPRVSGRTNAVVVPRERRGRGPPCGGGSNLKMALLALAGALIIGIAIKKYVLDK